MNQIKAANSQSVRSLKPTKLFPLSLDFPKNTSPQKRGKKGLSKEGEALSCLLTSLNETTIFLTERQELISLTSRQRKGKITVIEKLRL